jgi:hypothetical protein
MYKTGNLCSTVFRTKEYQAHIKLYPILNYRIIVNTIQCDSICRYLLPLHVSVRYKVNHTGRC